MQLRFDFSQPIKRVAFQEKPKPRKKPKSRRTRLTPKQADIVYKLKFQRGAITENRETGYINLDTEKDGISWEVISRATLEALKAKGMLAQGKPVVAGSHLYTYTWKRF